MNYTTVRAPCPGPWSHLVTAEIQGPLPLPHSDRLSICGLFGYVLATLKRPVNISTTSLQGNPGLGIKCASLMLGAIRVNGLRVSHLKS